MKTSGIIYHSEWEEDGESISLREEVVVSSLDTTEDEFIDRSISQTTNLAAQRGKITLPKRTRFRFSRKLFGVLLFFPKKLIKKIKSRKVLGFPLHATGRVFKQSSKKPSRVLKIIKVGKVFRYSGWFIASSTNNILKSLKRLLSVFKILKVVNKDRTSKVLKTSSKYSKKSGKAMYKSTKWLTIKTIKLVPPTASLTYRGAKKIRSNDILLRLAVATIAGLMFIGAVFIGTG